MEISAWRCRATTTSNTRPPLPCTGEGSFSQATHNLFNGSCSFRLPPSQHHHEKIITLDPSFECLGRGPALLDAADTGIWPIVFNSADQRAQRPVQSQAGNLWVQRHELAAMAGAAPTGGARLQDDWRHCHSNSAADSRTTTSPCRKSACQTTSFRRKHRWIDLAIARIDARFDGSPRFDDD